MDIKVSVLTLVKGRKGALLNLIKGLSDQVNSPLELVVIHMNEDIELLPATHFPCRSFSCYTPEKLPLAKARNLAVAQAQSEFCIFLDVDCIPGNDFIAAYIEAFLKGNTIWSGSVRYLKPGFPAAATGSLLDHWSTADPIRAQLKILPYELFWSLNFGCTKSVFKLLGGFDEQYTGYGAEDTDFSFTARLQDVALDLVPAMAYHQPHASYDPPLNHLEDIVKNATVFYHKWKRWPMEGWLGKFAALGYVSWTADTLTLINWPTPAAIEKHRK